MANPALPPDQDEARETLRKLKARMQGYKDTPETHPAVESADYPDPLTKPDTKPDLPAANIQESDDDIPVETEHFIPPIQSSPLESIPSSELSKSLLERFSEVGDVESTRYRSKPWRQLPDESSLEYALFGEFLKPPLAKGRDLDELAIRLSSAELTGWQSRLLNTIPVPKYVLDGPAVKKDSNKTDNSSSPELEEDEVDSPLVDIRAAETRLLWWLADINHWLERGRLFDAWQLDVLAEERRLQIQELAREIDSHHREHVQEMMGLIQEARKGMMKGVIAAGGQFRKIKETQNIPQQDAVYNARGEVTQAATPFIVREMEWDPFAQIDAINKIADRLYGPLPNMLDGDVTTVLDRALSLPPKVKSNGDVESGELTGGVPEKRRSDAPWLIERVNKVQGDMARRKLIEAPAPPTGPGENIKPAGT